MNELEIAPKTGKLKIIVVEDDELLLELAKKVAEGEGDEDEPAEVTCFTSAEEAKRNLEKILESDIVLLDIHLPGRDGRWLCREIRTAQKSPGRTVDPTPWIIAHTTDTDPETIEEVLHLGANNYVGKPLDPIRLSLAFKVARHNISRTRALKTRIRELERMVLNDVKP